MPARCGLRSASLVVILASVGVRTTVAQDCFQFPAGVDFAPLLRPEVTGSDGSPKPSSLAAPLFDHSTETRLAFTEIGALSFDLPWTLPPLELLRAKGDGLFIVALKTEGKVPTEKVLHLKSANNYTELNVTAAVLDRCTALTLRSDATEAGSFLTDLQFLGGNETIPNDNFPTGGYYPPSPKKPCNCSGEGNEHSGQTCGKWDSDCPNSGWCYVDADADCADLTASHSPGLWWSCIPCGGFYNNTGKGGPPSPDEFHAAPSPPGLGNQPAPAPQAARDRKIVTATGCACGGRFALGMSIGIAIGGFLSFLLQRLLCRKSYIGLPAEEEMGNKASHHA